MFTKKRLFTPGPTMVPDRVRLAMAQEVMHHRKPEFKTLMGGIQKGLGELFGTTTPVLPLTASGTGAMVAAVQALFNEKDTVLVIDGGKFAARWAEICETVGIAVIRHVIPWGQAVQGEDIERLLNEHPEVTGVLGQLCDTSSTVLYPVKDMAAITRKRDVLFVVDGVSGVSMSPCPMDDWGIDCLITGSQKGLMLPPGLAFIALSERAWQKAEQVGGGNNYYFNLLKERDNFLKQQTNYTPAVNLLVGLAESLAMFSETGLENMFRKQWALTRLVRDSMAALGFEFLAPEYYAWGVTGVILPEGVKPSALLAHASEEYGVVLAAGQDATKDYVVRIGHMGWIDYADMLGCVHAFAASFRACGGYLGCRNYLEAGMHSYEQALLEGYPRY